MDRALICAQEYETLKHPPFYRQLEHSRGEYYSDSFMFTFHKVMVLVCQIMRLPQLAESTYKNIILRLINCKLHKSTLTVATDCYSPKGYAFSFSHILTY